MEVFQMHEPNPDLATTQEQLDKNIFAVIMAGGVGSRLWPLSRKNQPKQFLDFFGDGTMIEKTVSRLSGVVPIENIFVVTNEKGKSLVKKQLPTLSPKNILVEPVGKNTAPCIALAAAIIKKRNPHASMIVLPADHVINDVALFQQTLKASVEVAEKTDSLVTIGIRPNRPETGYGYIQSEQISNEITTSIKVRFGITANPVKTFAEKPDLETAKKFLESGDFFWNSGVFIWKLSTIYREFQRCMPSLYKDMELIFQACGTRKEKEVIAQVYSCTNSISIDYGVMEKAESVYVMQGEFDWSDAGSWDEIMNFRLQNDRNEIHDNLLLQKTEKVMVLKPKTKTIALIGVEDLIVVDTPDALLICRRGHSQDVKHSVDTLKRKQLEAYM
ncbi:MAG: mannose-1-phosphate guanylyltransferase [Chloroherpetonaceae bacterium]|nr:mannose-1-phosphate guanylyltransferase [Chloroherpetonaceae bacterium]